MEKPSAIKIENRVCSVGGGGRRCATTQKFLLDLECTRTFSIPSVTYNAISIGQLARHSGLSTHTLRFYEAEGILHAAGRNASGHREYRSNDVLWLEFVLRLKHTGMPLAEIKRYATLRAEGDATLDARLAMLKLHRQRLANKIEELSTCASALDEKMHRYETMLAQASVPPTKATP